MAEEIVLTAEERKELGTRRIKTLRGKGLIPAVIYHKKESTDALSVKLADFEKTLKKGARLITLNHPKGKDTVLIKEVQYDHLGEKVLHIDFVKVAKDELITIEVPVILKGKPIGVVEEGGTLDHYIKIVKVSCLPANIPNVIEVDVSNLKLDQKLLIKDLKAPQGVKLLGEQDVTVASVSIHVVEEIVTAAAPTVAEPEVIKKERAEEEVEEEKGKAPAAEKAVAPAKAAAPAKGAAPAKEAPKK